MSSLPRIVSADPSANLPQTPEPALIRTQRETLAEVLRLVSERASAEAEVERERASRDVAADQEYAKARQGLVEKYAYIQEGDRKADEEGRRAIVDAAIAGEGEAKTEFARASRKIAADFDAVRERTKTEYARARGAATAAFEAGEKDASAKHAEAVRPIDKASKIIEAMRGRLAAVLENARKFGVPELAKTPSKETYKGDDLTDQVFDRLTKVEPALCLLEQLFFPRAMKGRRFLWIFVVLFLLLIVPMVQLQGAAAGAAITVVVTLVAGFLLRQRLYVLCKNQVLRLADPIAQALTDAEALANHCRGLAQERLKTQRTKVASRRDEEMLKAKHQQAKSVTAGEDQRDERLRQINETYARKVTEIQTRQQLDLRQAIETNEKRVAEHRAQYEANSRKLDERYQAVKARIRIHYETSWESLATRWRVGMEQARAALEGVDRAVEALGPRWDDPAWNDRPHPRAVPPVVRFGEFRLDLEHIPGGVSPDPRLREGIPPGFTLPALLAFPSRTNLLIETSGAGKLEASRVLQSTMLRLLTTLPPGQVRFTIVDPIGIGRNFGAFMHLADFDDSLVTHQVWTDPRQIEERLADLSAHMEKVTQKYLRNEYATIEEYNAVAGEVAEPYRVLVVADFPAAFDETSARRLAAIASGGVPCGVLTLVAMDRDRPLPPHVSVEELRPHAVSLSWEGDHLAWDDRDFGSDPLTLDQPPPAEAANRLIQRSGAAARDAKRVVVPFEYIAPAADQWWTGDSRAGVEIALGKAGATKKQDLSLGQGTSQHALLAGRTGSGKSTLLHALITNLALNFSPDEIDLYLIDFKKGVEFKVYATQGLPHASVVAIESEREFGISVLQRLDSEMQIRGERFRDAGVQDVNGYRNAPGTPPLPRLLLIVDEFQEFFVEDDKLAQEAAQLLDRLVRQGRAFGVHVILGSQSLGGAYALARTTLGQMAIRIALQCSEADASLILSEQNPAARLLSRPGEAIYNDANGMAEGNHFFQVVWLPDERREAYLKQLRDLARERPPRLSRTPIVFEGDAQADLARNALLKATLEEPAWPASPRSALAWLGDPVAIKEPTSALFRRQGGNHLLIVGQNDESALGILSAALLSLAAQFAPAESETARAGARFAVLDGTPEDHPKAESLAGLVRHLPHPVAIGGWRDAPRILAEMAAEVERRQQPGADDGPELFLLIHDLPRFRDLRKRENDFGFGRHDEEAGPTDHLATILREGSGLGVHLLIWCDNLNNLNRYFDHQGLREFEMRVLFQMSPNDSGHLLDAPHASRLGPRRALFSSEEQNRLEKFRPYGLPESAWLDWFGAQLRKRTAAVEG